MSWKYSITLSSFRNLEPIQTTLENLKKQGIDTIEVYGEPDKIDVNAISDQLDSYSFEVSGITGMWGLSSNEYMFRTLVTSDRALLTSAKNYVKKCISLCHRLGGTTFNICLFSDKRLVSDANHKNLMRDEKRKLVSHLVEPLRELVEYAVDYHVCLVIEPLNRYSTPICTDFEDAKLIVDLVDQENLGVMLDTFHMNIEEDSLYNTIINSYTLLKHVHISDNNRKMPGLAHIDFESVTLALKKIKYSRYLTFEPTFQNADYKKDIKYGLEYFRNLTKMNN